MLFRSIGKYELVLAGRQASDTDAGLVPHAVAVALDVPSISPVVAVDAIADRAIVVGKLTDAAIDYYEMPFPSVLCVSNEINKPRMPSLKGTMMAKKVQIEVLSATAKPREARATFAMKGGARQASTVIVKDGSSDDKAAALLAALGV